jgi:hypothetical protein
MSVNPILYPVQVDGRELRLEDILKSTLALHYLIRCLPAIEACRYFAMLALALVSTPRGFAFAAGWTATATDFLVVRALDISEGGED